MSGRPQVRLAELLQRSSETVAPLPDIEYREITVRLWGKGVVERGRTTGLAMTGRRFVARDGQFIASQIDARNGATGLVPASLDGALVTNDFPLFELNRDRLHPPYLGWLCRTASFVELCRRASEGTTNRVRLKEETFLAFGIALPPLPEQQRLVARIDAVATEIDHAMHIGRVAADEIEALTYSALRSVRDGLLRRHGTTHAMGDVFKVTSGGTPARDNPAFWGGDVPWLKTGELLDGDIHTAEERITDAAVAGSAAKVFPSDTVLIALYGQGQTRGRTGRLRIASATNQACCALLPVPDRADSRYVQYWLRTWYHDLREEAQGGAQPNWNGAMIKRLPIVLPSLAEQHRIVAELDSLQAEVDSLKAAHATTRTELDALLPAVLDRAFAGTL